MEIIQGLISPALCVLGLYAIRRYNQNTKIEEPAEKPKKQLIRSYYRTAA